MTPHDLRQEQAQGKAQEMDINAIRREIHDKLEVYAAADRSPILAQRAIVKQQCLDYLADEVIKPILADLTTTRQAREEAEQMSKEMAADLVVLRRERDEAVRERDHHAAALQRFMQAIGGSTVRLYADANYEKYLDDITGTAVDACNDAADANDGHMAALLRQMTEAVGALRRSRDELRRDMNRVALAAVEDEDANT